MTDNKTYARPKTMQELFDRSSAGKQDVYADDLIMEAALAVAMAKVRDLPLPDGEIGDALVVIMRVIAHEVRKGNFMKSDMVEALSQVAVHKHLLEQNQKYCDQRMTGMIELADQLRRENESLKAELAALRKGSEPVGRPVTADLGPPPGPENHDLSSDWVEQPRRSEIVAAPADGALQPCIPTKVQALRARFPDTVVDGHPPLNAERASPQPPGFRVLESTKDPVTGIIREVIEPAPTSDIERVVKTISPPPS